MVKRVYVPYEDERTCDWCGKSIMDASCFSIDEIPNTTDSLDFCCLRCLSAFGRHYPKYQDIVSELCDEVQTEEKD